MSEERYESIPRLVRFALQKRETAEGLPVVFLLVEAESETGDVTRTEGTMLPEDAIDNGNALAEIGLAQQATKH